MADKNRPLNFRQKQHIRQKQGNCKCLCGRSHAYVECYHLNPRIRPKGWWTEKELIAVINKKIDDDPSFREIIFDLGYEHYTCLCGSRHAYKACYFLNSSLTPEGWFTRASMERDINRQLSRDPVLAEKVRDLGYEDYKCLCGSTKHLFRGCFNLNPLERPVNWEMKKGVVMAINFRLKKNPDLRDRIVGLGYEYYRKDRTKLSKLFPPRPEETGSKTSAAPLFKVSEKKDYQLANLPNEILINIIEMSYELLLDELPESHPLVKYSPPYERKRARRQYPRTETNLRNYTPPTGKVGPERKEWLDKYPGQWGPIFQIMFVSKQFRDLAKPIRFRQVHIQGSGDEGSTEELCSRLANIQVLQELIKDVFITFEGSWRDVEKISKFVEILHSFTKLKHVCISLVGFNSHWNGGELTDSDKTFRKSFMSFFDLKVETLTFIWSTWEACRCNSSLTYVDEVENSLVPSDEELDYQTSRNDWIRKAYMRSSWYNGPEEKKPTPAGKTRLIRDWTATRGEDGKIQQWPMDRFVFEGDRAITACPTWNLWQNPRNHPSQLNAEELKASQQVRVWRKGFPELTEEED